MDTTLCVDALEEALRRFGTPEIFNTDQGSQSISEAFPPLYAELPHCPGLLQCNHLKPPNQQILSGESGCIFRPP